MSDQQAGVTAREERDELMRVLEPLLIEVEPLRFAQRQEIERQVEAKKAWADQHNARCGNSNEMWLYSAEFRRSLEDGLEPLNRAVREANEAYDRILAANPAAPAPTNLRSTSVQ